MLDVKLPQAVELGVRLTRSEILPWFTDECPLLILRLTFILTLFGGVCGFGLFFLLETSFFGSILLCIKGTGLFAFIIWLYNMLFGFINPVVTNRAQLPSDIKVLPPVAEKTDTNFDKTMKRVKDLNEFREGDIVCLELVDGANSKARNFLCISSNREVDTHQYMVAKLRGYRMCVRNVVEWIENPRDWKRFCFQIGFDHNNKIILRSIETDTFLFMMGMVNKILVAWHESSSFFHATAGSWERFEFKGISEQQISRHPLFLMNYCFDDKYLKYVDEKGVFELTNHLNRSARIALWKPQTTASLDTESKKKM